MNFTNSFHKEFYDFYEHTTKDDMKKDLLFICYVVVSLLERQKRRTKTLMKGVDVADRQEYVDAYNKGIDI